jgi:D-arabinose 1-dehydrogenase-like Zn-dependent alcohol dehydrogenase
MTTDNSRPAIAPERDATAASELNLFWPFSGGDIGDLGVDGAFVAAPVPRARDDEVIVRVDTVCICSSDVKLIRMGTDHPLFTERDLAASPVVLGHELSVTVTDVGARWAGRYRTGQRLGIQPAIIKDGQRLTIGIDLPGGLSRYLRLDGTVLGQDAEAYVFEVPESLSAATIALLEPYSCVEAAYRPNSRTSLQPGGRLLVVGDGAAPATLSLDVAPAEAVLVAPPPSVAAWARGQAARVSTLSEIPSGQEVFDDIILIGRHDAATVEQALGLLRRNGLIALIAASRDLGAVAVDAARIHYHGIGIVGAPGLAIDEAFGPEHNRFDLEPGGCALILGAGGAMGRIHVHRALGMAAPPSTIIATSRKGARLDGLKQDFGALAAERGCALVVVEDDALEAALEHHAPAGVDDAVVVAPDIAAIERAARFLAPGGLLVLFAGVPFGKACRLPLGRVSHERLRITGSTGSTVQDQLSVLDRVVAGDLDPTRNLEAVAGFDAVPDALKAVTEGRVNGKVAIYPGVLGLPLTAISRLKAAWPGRGDGWSLEDEKAMSKRA